MFTEEEYKQIEDSFNNPYFSSIKNVNSKTKNYISFPLHIPPLIDAFREESDKLLENGYKWQKESIKKDRIEYFKNFGIDLGDDYEVYEKDERTKTLIPSKELVTRIISTTNMMYTQMKNEYYTSLPEYKVNRKRIDSANLLDQDDGYDANAYEVRTTAIITNIKKEGDKYIEYPLLLLNMGVVEEYLDHALIHELNHVYELSIPTIDGNSYKGTCGWDEIMGEMNTKRKELVSLEKRTQKRNYELFNEIINELIAQEISEILSQSEQYIFNTKEDKKIKGSTSYERTLFLVKDFYETFKKEIIESRKNGDMTVLFNAVGKENFESLNNLFHIYNENFSGLRIISVYEDLKAGKETEKTKKYKEIVTKKQEIFMNMQQHHQRNSMKK